MATMTHNEATGARTFTVPIDASIPHAPFHGRAELVIETTAPGDRPARLVLRFFPIEFEFQVKLAKLLEEGRFNVYPPELSRRAQVSQPIVVYEADPAALPAGLADLPALEAFLRTAPKPVFDLSRYALAAIEFGADE